jgi:dihydroxy-acid dehydratase
MAIVPERVLIGGIYSDSAQGVFALLSGTDRDSIRRCELSEERSGTDRSLTSYGDPGFSRFLRGAFLSAAGFDRDDLNRPIIGIADLRSDFNPCHKRLPDIIEQVKRGVLQAGGLPMVFPTISLGETLLSPTSMLFRNLLAMETEEMIRAQPMDAVILIGGCDKTVPAQMMAAAVSDIPVILEVTGPMITNTWQGERLGACTDCRRMWARYRAGDLAEAQIEEVEGSLATTSGTCMVMGTASTMACMAEALGLMLPGGATPPSPTGDRGRHAVELARHPILPREILTKPAFQNAITVLGAIGGSTNAIVHLLAIARRAKVDITLKDFDEICARVPLMLNLKPSGGKYMEDFDQAGGLPVLMKELESILDLGHVGVTGKSLRDNLSSVPLSASWQDVIYPINSPFGSSGALAVLFGSLAPDGAVIKVSAANPKLMQHTGPAIVFESSAEAALKLDDPNFEVTAEHVLVLRNSGPKGAGMPEAGSLPIPKKLALAGVTDMVRVSDARMSGTSYGTVVLHCSPESAIGGPLALVRNDDLIRLDVSNRTIDLLVEESELAKRRATLIPMILAERGWLRLHQEHVTQANDGADMDFL